MDIMNIVRNVIASKLDDIDIEEIAEEAVSELIESYTDIEDRITEAAKEHIRNNICYEHEVDKAICEYIEDNF